MVLQLFSLFISLSKKSYEFPLLTVWGSYIPVTYSGLCDTVKTNKNLTCELFTCRRKQADDGKAQEEMHIFGKKPREKKPERL